MELDQSVIHAFSDTATVEQTIRLGSSETIVSSWLADFLTHFTKSRPRLSFDLTVDTSNNLRNALVTREIDLAFLMGPIAEASISNSDLCSYEMIFAATPMVAGRSMWSPEDLAQQVIVTFSGSTRPHRLLREMLAQYATGELKMTGSASLGAIVQLGVAGYGICALPRAIISDELERGVLKELRTPVKMPPISFTASFVSGTATSSLMAEISDEATKFLRPKLINKIYQN
jgi:DNA-binding transcriptional LysR family regulator